MAQSHFSLSKEASDEAISRFVEQIIQNAILHSASDIHIEPYAETCRIRFRCDGLLQEITRVPATIAGQIITLLKVMAKLNIAEKRLPQDGRLHLHATDIRINTCPTLFGEKIVLRLLKGNTLSLAFEHLGLSEQQKNILIDTIAQPQGFILITGPTGSGKTLTLYAIVNYLNSSEKNIATVEDPIEIQLFGINQINIHPKIGLDFPNVLRTLLRQDPDVLMVGEIRDRETAEIALQAAETGHLILSTVHTNSALDTIARLAALGIAPHRIVRTVSLIIAQRLIRLLCHHCKTIDSTAAAPYPVYRAIGCPHCFQGFKGRTAIYEFFMMNHDNATQVLKNLPTALSELPNQALYQAALAKVAAGQTSLAEVKRVLG